MKNEEEWPLRIRSISASISDVWKDNKQGGCRPIILELAGGRCLKKLNLLIK